MNIDLGVYLIPGYESPEEGYAYLEEHHQQIFENELACWTTDRTLWPQDRSFRALRKHFHFAIDDPVFDLGTDKLRREAFDQ